MNKNSCLRFIVTKFWCLYKIQKVKHEAKKVRQNFWNTPHFIFGVLSELLCLVPTKIFVLFPVSNVFMFFMTSSRKNGTGNQEKVCAEWCAKKRLENKTQDAHLRAIASVHGLTGFRSTPFTKKLMQKYLHECPQTHFFFLLCKVCTAERKLQKKQGFVQSDTGADMQSWHFVGSMETEFICVFLFNKSLSPAQHWTYSCRGPDTSISSSPSVASSF